MSIASVPSTLFDKVWHAHVIEELGDGWALLHIDRHLLHDLSGSRGMGELDARGLGVPQPQLAFATPDHTVSSAPGRTADTFAGGAPLVARLEAGASKHCIRFFALGDPGQGIVHVMGPELGIVQPGSTVICGDSHTCTNGALGAMAFGVGSSELTHALATQTLMQRKPKNMRIRFEGNLASGTTAKDLILHTIGLLGASAGTGYAIEYAGPAIEALSVEERMTVCNMSIEMGARVGMVAPDQRVFGYLQGRRFSPRDAQWLQAVDHWQTLHSDPAACFDREEVSTLAPSCRW